jgi:hypothetical protein
MSAVYSARLHRGLQARTCTTSISHSPLVAYSFKLLLTAGLLLTALTFLHPRTTLLVVSSISLFAVASNVISIIIR